MEMTRDAYYEAHASHDRRFDGVFFTCVRTTGVYCRPVCPTAMPKQSNCTFVTSATTAEAAGYRPCLRCRPELAPASRDNLGRSPAARLARRIDTTLLIDEPVEKAASAYGISARQMRRQFMRLYGVEPKQYATTQRLLFAKRLLHDTALPVIDVAASAGFNSASRLTENMKHHYKLTPSQIRTANTSLKTARHITLTASYRPPFDWQALLDTLQVDIAPSEWVAHGRYYRLHAGQEIVVSHAAEQHAVRIQIPLSLIGKSYQILTTVRQLFDLDCDPSAIAEVLGHDPLLAKVIRRFPGIRMPGCWDPFETVMTYLLAYSNCGSAAGSVLRHLSNRIGLTAPALAASSTQAIAGTGVPTVQAAALYRLSTSIVGGNLSLNEADPEGLTAQLKAIPCIDDKALQYLHMRILKWPDALPTPYTMLREMLCQATNYTDKQLDKRVEAWRPWRAYAAILLDKARHEGIAYDT